MKSLDPLPLFTQTPTIHEEITCMCAHTHTYIFDHVTAMIIALTSHA